MKSIRLLGEGLVYLVLIGVAAPLLWWLGREEDLHTVREMIVDFDDDDPGEDSNE